MRGLRRGEATGLRWTDVDLDQRVIMISQQHLAYGRTVESGPPKTRASRRTIDLDRTTVALLRKHLQRRQADHLAAGHRWHDAGHVFTAPDGQPLHLDWITRRFGHLVKDSALPPVRQHDLRAPTGSRSAGSGKVG